MSPSAPVTTSSPVDPTGHLFASIPKLTNDGRNFMLWKYHVREILKACNLLDYVTGDNIKKDPGENVTGHTDWVTRNREVHQQITLTLEDDLLMGVMHLSDTNAIWTGLCTCYEGSGIQAISYLMGKIWCKQFNDASDLETQINKLCSHALKLANLGFTLPDKIFWLLLFYYHFHPLMALSKPQLV